MSLVVLTVVTDPHHKKLNRYLKQSCDYYGLTVKVLTIPESAWKGFGKRMKDKAVLSFISKLSDDTLILLSDGYDAFMCAGEAEIVSKFSNFGTPLVFSCEVNCSPSPATMGMHPQSPTPCRYLNSGGYMGRVGDLKRILPSVMQVKNPDRLYWSNQHAWQNWMARNPGQISLDYYSDIFFTGSQDRKSRPALKDPKFNELSLIRFHETVRRSSDHLLVDSTQSSPCHVHMNGLVENIMAHPSMMPFYPWLTDRHNKFRVMMGDKEVEKILSYLRPDFRMLEYGSGGSTFRFSAHVKTYHSVEHDRKWAHRMWHRTLPKNVELFVADTDVPGMKITQFAKNSKELSNSQFSKKFDTYIREPARFRAAYDAVLIDGRARAECAKFILPYLKKGALVFVHDFWKPQYAKRQNWKRLMFEHYDVVDSVMTEEDRKKAGDNEREYLKRSLVVLKPKRARPSRGKVFLATPKITDRYTLAMLAKHAGYKVVSSAHVGPVDLAAFHNDKTKKFHDPDLRTLSRSHRIINYGSTDISKRRIQLLFNQVFGYPLAVDPLRYKGQIVEKPDKNGCHSGVILDGPVKSVKRDKVYERYVESTQKGLHVAYRLTYFGGVAMPDVNISRRPLNDIFGRLQVDAENVKANDVFTVEEQSQIRDLCNLLGVDFGEIDALRDADGRLYVVDVNDTPQGAARKFFSSDALWKARLDHLVEHFRVFVHVNEFGQR
jgi:hypothetical protein